MRSLIVVIIFIALGAAVSGCATVGSPRPAVYAYPLKGQTVEQQSRDVAECQQWAQYQTGYNPNAQVAKGVGIGTLLGALGGAATGAAIGAVTGHPAAGAAIGAAAAGIGGGIAGGALSYKKTREGYTQAFAACMKARHYTVG